MNGQLKTKENKKRLEQCTPIVVRHHEALGHKGQNLEINSPTEKNTTLYSSKQRQSIKPYTNKPSVFKSHYINDNGRWTQKAVDDGFVEFDDYISDIKNDKYGISFNGKPMKLSNHNLFSRTDSEKASYNGKKIDFPISSTYPAKKANYFTYISNMVDMYNEYKWVEDNLGKNIAKKAYTYGDDSLSKAEQKMNEWGLKSTWNNKADAYRHFIWNAQMTRDTDVGYYHARNVTNKHEYETMYKNNWINLNSGGFDYLKDNTIIKGKMNQECIMDLWNNQVGRELANNNAFSDKSVEELFDFAQDYGLLINDAATVYEKLGITDYIVNQNEYTV